MTQPQNLDELLRRTGGGDSQAFDALYNVASGPLLAYLWNHFSSSLSQQDMEDVIHSMFVRLPKTAETYRGDHNASSAWKWLYTIVRNDALKMVREYKRYSRDDSAPHEPHMEIVPSVSKRSPFQGELPEEDGRHVENEALKKAVLNQVLQYVRTLPAQDQKVFYLRFVQNYTLEKIGREIGRTKVRVKQIVDGLVRRIQQELGVDLSQDRWSFSDR